MALLALLALALLSGCGRREGAAVVEGPLRAGDLNYWLVGETLVAIGGAQMLGEPSQVGSRVRVEGQRRPDGVVAATRITVDKAGTVVPSLPAAALSGDVETVDRSAGEAKVAGRVVRLAPGALLPANLAAGDRVQVSGYTLPDGAILAAEFARVAAAPPPPPAVPTPVATATRVPAQTAVAPPPAAAPTAEPAGKPRKPKTKGQPDNQGATMATEARVRR